MIIGACGVPLSYVIRETEARQFDRDVPFDETVIQAASLEGDEFRLDSWTMHQLILMNIIEDSDTYTYIKTLLCYQNGR